MRKSGRRAASIKRWVLGSSAGTMRVRESSERVSRKLEKFTFFSFTDASHVVMQHRIRLISLPMPSYPIPSHRIKLHRAPPYPLREVGPAPPIGMREKSPHPGRSQRICSALPQRPEDARGACGSLHEARRAHCLHRVRQLGPGAEVPGDRARPRHRRPRQAHEVAALDSTACTLQSAAREDEAHPSIHPHISRRHGVGPSRDCSPSLRHSKRQRIPPEPNHR
jgi:hypothetical protein